MTNEEIDKLIEDNFTWISEGEPPRLYTGIVRSIKLFAQQLYDKGFQDGFDACKKSLNVD